jgi:hypothetical protein
MDGTGKEEKAILGKPIFKGRWAIQIDVVDAMLKKAEEGSWSFDDLAQCIVDHATSHTGRATAPSFKQAIKAHYGLQTVEDLSKKGIFVRFIDDLKKHRADLLKREQPAIGFPNPPRGEEWAEIQARHARKRQEAKPLPATLSAQGSETIEELRGEFVRIASEMNKFVTDYLRLSNDDIRTLVNKVMDEHMLETSLPATIVGRGKSVSIQVHAPELKAISAFLLHAGREFYKEVLVRAFSGETARALFGIQPHNIASYDALRSHFASLEPEELFEQFTSLANGMHMGTDYAREGVALFTDLLPTHVARKLLESDDGGEGVYKAFATAFDYDKQKCLQFVDMMVGDMGDSLLVTAAHSEKGLIGEVLGNIVASRRQEREEKGK